MRYLRRNYKPFKYVANPSQYMEPLYDDDGNLTGEEVPPMQSGTLCYGNVTSEFGEQDARMYGIDQKYGRYLLLSKLPEGMTEQSGVWVDDLDADWPDYIVRRISRSLNGVQVTLTKVMQG